MGSLCGCACLEAASADLTTNFRYVRDGHGVRNRDRISRYLDHSAFGVGLDIVLALVSLAYVAAYITNTYIPVNMLPLWLWLTELLCATCFAVDYAFRGVYLSDHRLDYVLSLMGIVSLIVILPVLPISFFLNTLWYDDSYWRFVYPLRFVKCYVELRAVLSRCHGFMTPVKQFALLCYLQIVLIIAGAAGIIQIAETSDGVHNTTDMGEWTFFNSFFNSVLVFVTIQTPPADNVLAKVFVGVLVVVLILIVPYQVSRVLDLGKTFSQYELTAFKPSGTSKHIVLCGDLTPSRIDHFFSEVFHDDHDIVDINVVVLSEDEPSTPMIALLMDPFFEKRTSFIQGSILDVDDAQRAACSQADAIFILSRRCDQEEAVVSDHRTFMRVMAAKRLAPRARIHAQMHLSSNRHLMDDLDVKNVMYFSEVVHSLLGQNCVCPGFSTFMYNLTSTSSYDDAHSHIASDNAELDDSWEERYLRGASHEVYSVDLPPAAIVFGKTFAEIAALVYSNCAGVILFAIVPSIGVCSGKILLNPGDSYTCVGGETVFVIAKDRREADAVTNLRTTAYVNPSSVLPTSYVAQQKSSSVVSLLYSKTNVMPPQIVTSGAIAPPTPRRKSKIIDWQIPSLDNELAGNERRQHGAESAVVEHVRLLDMAVAPIVVCVLSKTTFPKHFEYLIGPVRVKELQRHRPVIIITPVLPPPETYATFRHFRQVFFVIGSAFDVPTLERAGVDRAHKIVIMSHVGESGDSGSSELLSDASGVALHKTIASFIGPKRVPRIITELVNRANVHFITQNLSVSDWFPSFNEARQHQLASSSSTSFARNFLLSPAFASGLAYSTSLCDSLLINQYFNSQIKSILREFIFASWKDEDYVATPLSPPNPNAGSNAASPASSSSSPTGSVKRSSMFAVEVPLDFVGKSFEYVFQYLLSSDGILTIGLYRCRPDDSLHFHHVNARIQLDEKSRSVPYGYAYVNPFPEDILTGNDLLYVLSHKQPRWV
ncbi:Calcium-activated potassium channel subunit alpha, partial [Globisporangium splendens]